MNSDQHAYSVSLYLPASAKCGEDSQQLFLRLNDAVSHLNAMVQEITGEHGGRQCFFGEYLRHGIDSLKSLLVSRFGLAENQVYFAHIPRRPGTWRFSCLPYYTEAAAQDDTRWFNFAIRLLLPLTIWLPEDVVQLDDGVKQGEDCLAGWIQHWLFAGGDDKTLAGIILEDFQRQTRPLLEQISGLEFHWWHYGTPPAYLAEMSEPSVRVVAV